MLFKRKIAETDIPPVSAAPEAEAPPAEPVIPAPEAPAAVEAPAPAEAEAPAAPAEAPAPAPEEKKRDKRTWLIVLLILLLLLMAGTLVWFIFLRGAPAAAEEETFFDPMAQTGILPDMTEEQIREELNRVVEEGMLNIAISGEIVFQDGGSLGKANINNTQANHYIIRVVLTLDETGEVLYESGGISPGQYIQYISLNRDLPEGEYAATATFTAYTVEDHQTVGSAAARVMLYVLA